MASARSRPPQLLFDDGSRVMQETEAALDENFGRPPTVSLTDYYELERLFAEISPLIDLKNDSSTSLFRLALQFPDYLLSDAPAVCQAWQERLDALVFVLGDTTFSPCCPDAVAAAHLQADCLIHYGPEACLTQTVGLPVYYSFGRGANLQTTACLSAVQQAITQETRVTEGVLLLYQLDYHYAIADLQAEWKNQIQDVTLQVGQLPSYQSTTRSRRTANSRQSSCARPDCCQTDDSQCDTTDSISATAQESSEESSESINNLIVGGLQLPDDIQDWTKMVVLFVGDDTSRQYLQIVLRFLSATADRDRPAHLWTWRPKDQTLSRQPSNHFSRILARRFFLVQKAKQARTVGILVANLDGVYQRVVTRLRDLSRQHDKAVYTMVVGKMNPAKLANFPQVDVYVLVSCPQHALLQEEREYATPVVTPLEYSMALGVQEWGALPYSLHMDDFIVAATETTEKDDDDEEDNEDAPYFSMVTGRYEAATTTAGKEESEQDATTQEGGTIMVYQSAAAQFLQQREYQGLTVQAGETPVHTAVAGQDGIASAYNGDR